MVYDIPVFGKFSIFKTINVAYFVDAAISEGTFEKYIDHIEGDYNNVVGFPWERISVFLQLHS